MRLACGLLAASSVLVADARAAVAVAPVVVDGAVSDASAVRVDVDAALAAVLQGELVRVAPGCAATTPCFAAARAAASEGVLVEVVADGAAGGGAFVYVRVVDPDGQQLGAFQAPLKAGGDRGDGLRALFTEALTPAAYVGTATISGVGATDIVTVDGLVVDVGAPLRLRAGAHRFVKKRADGAARAEDAVVPFDDSVSVDLDGVDGGFVDDRGLFVIGSGAVAGAGVVGVGVVLARELFILLPARERLLTAECPRADQDPRGLGFSGQGISRDAGCTTGLVREAQLVRTNQGIDTALGVAFAALAVVGAAALIPHLLSPPPDDGVDDEAAKGPP